MFGVKSSVYCCPVPKCKLDKSRTDHLKEHLSVKVKFFHDKPLHPDSTDFRCLSPQSKALTKWYFDNNLKQGQYPKKTEFEKRNSKNEIRKTKF